MELKPKAVIDLLRALSWQKIIQLFLLAVIILGAWAAWDNRIVIYNSIRIGATVELDSPYIATLSTPTKLYLSNTLEKSKHLVMGIEIVTVDFKKNSRNTSFFIFNDSELKEAYTSYLQVKVSDPPLFTANEVNNQRLIHLINGEFTCSDYKDTLAPRLLIASPKNITTICSISIPPYYGRFTGYMNIYLNKKPSGDDLTFARQLARDISLRIFEHDVINKPSIGYKE